MSKIKPDPAVSIGAFYAGRSILITGATGFLGKVLMEKLLRSCPEVKEIFLLMRPKKGVSIDDRLRQILALPLYDKLRNERPAAFEKLIPVTGDVAAEGLGLPDVERRVLIEKVSVIFHVAASVRFDDSLRDAVFINLRSTRDICILAGNMKNLVALVHVSSTYTQTDKPVVEEIMYPFDVNWKRTIKIAETVDDHTLRILTAKYLGTMPNTYTFTKRLAEQVINDYANVLPCVVFRPSIVISTLQEPIQGWIDNFNGPVGMMIGGGKGILRVMYMNRATTSDFIPVDVAIKAMIVAAWKRGLKSVTKNPTPDVYNCCSSDIRGISMGEVVEAGFRINQSIPLDGVLWRPSTVATTSPTVYYILALVLHVLPAILIDTLIKLSGGRPILMRIQRKVFISNRSLSYFTVNEWKFKNKKLVDILSNVSPEDLDAFGFYYYDFDIYDFFRQSMIGAKLYLLKEDMSRLEEAKKHYNRMWWVDIFVKIWLNVVFTWLLYRAGVFSYIWTTIVSTLDGSAFESAQ